MTANIKCLKHVHTGQLFAYTDELAQRADMVPYDGPAQTGQSVDVLESERTRAERIAETNAKVEALLREQQGHLDDANRASAEQRKAFESENDALKRRVAELEAAAAATRLMQPGHAPADPVPAPAHAPTEWAVPEGAEVIEHTSDPVLVTDKAPAHAVADAPVDIVPQVAPQAVIAQAAAPVLPQAAADIAAAMK